MNDLIITGGAGFIGSSLLDRWVREYPSSRIIIIDLFTSFYDPRQKRANIAAALANCPERIALLEIDIASDPHELASVIRSCAENTWGDFVSDHWTMVHLAANAGVRPSREFPYQYARTNAVGTMSVLEAARILGIRNVVNASSSSVYGRRSTVPFLEDDTIMHPQSPYAATKVAGELFCENFAILHKVHCISLRLFTVYGPRQRPDLAIHQFARKILNDEPITLYGNGTTARDYTFIDDILKGIIGAIGWLRNTRSNTDGIHHAVNLGSNNPIVLTRMISTLEAALGKKAKVQWSELPAEDVLITYANVEKAATMFGYAPTVAFEDGIAKFCEWIAAWK